MAVKLDVFRRKLGANRRKHQCSGKTLQNLEIDEDTDVGSTVRVAVISYILLN